MSTAESIAKNFGNPIVPVKKMAELMSGMKATSRKNVFVLPDGSMVYWPAGGKPVEYIGGVEEA